MPWPDQEEHPVWEGVKALHFLLTDTVMPFRDRFEDREVTAFQTQFSITDARQKLTRAVSMIRTLLAEKVVPRIAGEPFTDYFWGQDLPGILVYYWRIAAKTAGDWDRVRTFPADVQSHISALWSGQGKDWGIGDVFPPLAATHAIRPVHFARLAWPKLTSDLTWDNRQFITAEETARRAAAVLLFWILRKAV